MYVRCIGWYSLKTVRTVAEFLLVFLLRVGPVRDVGKKLTFKMRVKNTFARSRTVERNRPIVIEYLNIKNKKQYVHNGQVVYKRAGELNNRNR